MASMLGASWSSARRQVHAVATVIRMPSRRSFAGSPSSHRLAVEGLGVRPGQRPLLNATGPAQPLPYNFFTLGISRCA
ncbi:MAG: hypothetical protein ACRDTT_01400 [Pseudonocardiaceae bacterium]